MNQSESIAKLAKSLSKVQGELKPAVMNSVNPYFKSRYADLNAVWDACRDLLSKNGIAVSQGFSSSTLPESDKPGVIVVTTLMHESGEWLQSDLWLPVPKGTPQDYGSAITYGRRYALAAMVGIVADEDDDANSAMPPKENQPAVKSAPARPPVNKPAAKKADPGKPDAINEGQKKAIFQTLQKKELKLEGLEKKFEKKLEDFTFDEAVEAIQWLQNR